MNNNRQSVFIDSKPKLAVDTNILDILCEIDRIENGGRLLQTYKDGAPKEAFDVKIHRYNFHDEFNKLSDETKDTLRRCLTSRVPTTETGLAELDNRILGYFALYYSVIGGHVEDENKDVQSVVGLFVSPTVYYEASLIPNLQRKSEFLNFIGNVCLVPYFEIKNGKPFFPAGQEVKDLAQKYIEGIEVKNGDEIVHIYPAMDADLSPVTAENKPSNDCYAMAWASVYGCMFLTENIMHFISFNRAPNGSHVDHARASRIQNINIGSDTKHQRTYYDMSGVAHSAAPVTISDITALKQGKTGSPFARLTSMIGQTRQRDDLFVSWNEYYSVKRTGGVTVTREDSNSLDETQDDSADESSVDDLSSK